MIASTSCRSGSACQRETASPPARRTARAASRSSKLPGNVTTPIRTGQTYSAVDREVLDHRVGEQRVGEAVQRLVVDRVGDLQLEVLALPHVGDARDAEATQRAHDGLPLRVED